MVAFVPIGSSGHHFGTIGTVGAEEFRIGLPRLYCVKTLS